MLQVLCRRRIDASLKLIDPFSPWSSFKSNFRLNTIDSQSLDVSANGKKYTIYTSPSSKAAATGVVDIKITDAETKETLKTFANVECHFNEEGELVSSINGEKIKSNVVLRNEHVVVFDKVRRKMVFDLEHEQIYSNNYDSICYSTVEQNWILRHQSTLSAPPLEQTA